MLADSAADERYGSFSPDGRYLAFSTNETGEYEVIVREISSGRTFPVSTSTRGGAAPQWSRDGTEIYYMSRIGPGLLVAGVTMEPFSATEPVEISDIRRRQSGNLDVTEDGQRFLVSTPVSFIGNSQDAAIDSPRIQFILNWFEELKQRVPTGR